MKRWWISLLIFFISYLTSSAQELVKGGKDSVVYYIDYSELLTLKAFTLTKISDVTFTDDVQDKSVIYKPNEETKLGLGFNYKWIGLNIAFMPIGKNDDDLYGKTKALDIQTDIFTRKFGGQFHLIRYRGLYWEDAENYIVDFKPSVEGYPTRPDIQTTAYGVNAFYNFNHEKFSFRAAFIHNERQVKSAGSFLAGFYFNRLNIQSLSDSAYLVPSITVPILDSELLVNSITTFNLGSMGGYAHTFVFFDRFFVTGGLIIGLGAERTERYYKNQDNRDELIFNALGNVKLAFGFNSKDFYFGINANAIRSTVGAGENSNIGYSSGAIRVIWAYRFKSKALDKLYDNTIGKVIKR